MESYEVMERYFPGTIEQLDRIFYGMAFHCVKSTADGGQINSEKVLKFSRSAMREMREEEDKQRRKREHANRYAKLVAFYTPENIANELSPFEE